MPKQSDINAKKTSFFQWLDLSKEQRFPSTYVDKAKELGVRVQTLNRWEREGYSTKEDSIGRGIDFENEDELRKRWVRNQVELVLGGKATAEDRKTLGKHLGLLIDKSEHTLKKGTLDADEYFTIRAEAERRLGQFSRDRGLLPEPTLLSVEVREDTGQTEGDNPI